MSDGQWAGEAPKYLDPKKVRAPVVALLTQLETVSDEIHDESAWVIADYFRWPALTPELWQMLLLATKEEAQAAVAALSLRLDVVGAFLDWRQRIADTDKLAREIEKFLTGDPWTRAKSEMQRLLQRRCDLGDEMIRLVQLDQVDDVAAYNDTYDKLDVAREELGRQVDALVAEFPELRPKKPGTDDA